MGAAALARVSFVAVPLQAEVLVGVYLPMGGQPRPSRASFASSRVVAGDSAAPTRRLAAASSPPCSRSRPRFGSAARSQLRSDANKHAARKDAWWASFSTPFSFFTSTEVLIPPPFLVLWMLPFVLDDVRLLLLVRPLQKKYLCQKKCPLTRGLLPLLAVACCTHRGLHRRLPQGRGRY